MREATIIHQGALGDFILSLPVYAGLRTLYPKLILHFIIRPAYAELIAHEPYCGHTVSCDASVLTALYQDESWHRFAPPEPLLQSEAVFWFGQESSRNIATRLQALLGKPVFWLCSFPKTPMAQPISDFLISQVQRLGFRVPFSLPALRHPPPPQGPILMPKGETMAAPLLLHPGSGGRAKIWPLGRWHALIRRLRHGCAPVRLVLGPADEALLAFAEAMAREGCSWELSPTLPRLAALIRSSRAVVGNDSGVSHLAAALGAPLVAIFGPASTAMWQPRGERVRIVTASWDPTAPLSWPAGAGDGDDLLVFQRLTELLQEPRGWDPS